MLVFQMQYRIFCVVLFIFRCRMILYSLGIIYESGWIRASFGPVRFLLFWMFTSIFFIRYVIYCMGLSDLLDSLSSMFFFKIIRIEIIKIVWLKFKFYNNSTILNAKNFWVCLIKRDQWLIRLNINFKRIIIQKKEI